MQKSEFVKRYGGSLWGDPPPHHRKPKPRAGEQEVFIPASWPKSVHVGGLCKAVLTIARHHDRNRIIRNLFGGRYDREPASGNQVNRTRNPSLQTSNHQNHVKPLHEPPSRFDLGPGAA